MVVIYFIVLFSFSISQETNCISESISSNRSIYSVGETISIEDQNILFPVCNGDDDYSTDDFFSLSNLNGSLNGGEYKITIISMNATW